MTQFPGSAVIPQKFVDGQGNVNVAALAQGLQHLGGDPMKHVEGGGTFNVEGLSQDYLNREAAGGKPKVDATVESIAAATKAPVIQTEAVTSPAQVNWDSLAAEIQMHGSIQPGTRKSLEDAGVPAAMIAQHEAGVLAIAENNLRKMADAVGGSENYAKFVEWANSNMPIEDRQTLFDSMNRPGGHLALQGAYSQFVAAGSVKAGGGEPRDINTLGGGGVAATGATPFGSRTERSAAFRDIKYGRDGEYTELVNERARATHAAVQTLKLRDQAAR